MRTPIKLLFLFILFKLKPDVLAQQPQDWIYIDGDEFNGSYPNFITKWAIPDDRCLVKSGELQYYTDSGNFQMINEGAGLKYLRIIAKKERINARAITYLPDSFVFPKWGTYNKRWFSYTSGSIRSQKPFKHGFFEIRCRTPFGKGFWPAFWLFGFANEEIDIFEMKGELPASTHWALHGLGQHGDRHEGGWVYCPSGNQNFTNSFNLLQVIWRPNLIDWKVNNKIIAYHNTDYLYQMRLMANLALAGNDPLALFRPGVDSINTPFPGNFDIDFIRIWHPINCDEVKQICNYAQTFQDPTAITAGIIYFANNGNGSCNNYLVGDPNGSYITRQYLDLAATQQIVIGPNSYLIHGSEFRAQIGNCIPPGMQGVAGPVGEDSIFERIPDESFQAPILNNTNDEDKFEVFPNPTHSVFYIINTELDSYFDVEVLNLQGQVLYKEVGRGKKLMEINLSDRSSGIYFLKITMGNKQTIKKIYLSQ